MIVLENIAQRLHERETAPRTQLQQLRGVLGLCWVCGGDLEDDDGSRCKDCVAEEEAANRWEDGDDLKDWPARPRGI